MSSPGFNAEDLGARVAAAAENCRVVLESSPAERWEVFAKTSLTRQTELVNSQLHHTVEVEEHGIGLRSWDGSRAGFAAVSGFGPDAAQQLVESAHRGALPAADPMPPQRFLGSNPIPSGPAMPPPGWAQHVAGELGLAMAGLTRNGLELNRTIAQEGRFRWLLTTGDGWSAEDERMVSSLLIEIIIGERSGTWREWVHIADPESFDAGAVANRIGNRALLTGHRVTTDQGLHDLILHPEVSAHLLASVSPLFVATDEAGDPLPGLLDPDGLLASWPLTIVDDRTDPGAPVVSPCDGEGLPARRTLLLEEGAPRHRLASWADARRFDEVPRGGAVRLSYRDRPASGSANLRVETDDGVPAGELLSASRRALYLLRPLAPVVCDPANDTYSLVASGVWLERQRVRGWQPVVELTGGLGTLLRRIDAVGTDLAWYQTAAGMVGAPSLLIRRQPVVG